MADNSNIPIDIQAAKNTKLFKKFMQNKNKSMVAPQITHVDLPKQENQDYSNHFHQNISPKHYSPPHSQNYNLQDKPVLKQYQETTYDQQNYQRKTVEVTSSHQKFEDTEFRKKYERMMGENEELKLMLGDERKQNKKIILKLQAQIEQCNKKIFDITSHEDQLIMENRRLREKTSTEVKDKEQYQHENRELNNQIQELKDFMQEQERATKRRQDEANHWKKQNQQLRSNIKDLQIQNQRLQDSTIILDREKMAAIRDSVSKDHYVKELKQKINDLISQNSELRDEVFQLSNRIYQMEQQNTIIRADLRRHSEHIPQSRNTQFHVHEFQQEKRTQSIYQNSNSKKEEQPDRRRRGEFARERGHRKIQSAQMDNKDKINVVVQTLSKGAIAQKMRRRQQLEAELQKILDMRALNGNLRRQKIGIQREISQIQDFFKSQNL